MEYKVKFRLRELRGKARGIMSIAFVFRTGIKF